MIQKATKTKAKTNSKSSMKKGTGCCSAFCHPSTWLIAILALALLAVCGISAYGFEKLSSKTDIESAKLAVFDHLADSYISDMDFTVNYDQPTVTQATGYGVSDEDGVFYITFDFAPYPAEDAPITSIEDIDLRHGIIYFQWDPERNTYGHAFSYHDDDYHPSGVYYEL